MKLRHFIYGICLAGLAMSSCQKEDELANVIDLSSPYVLDYLKDSQDPFDKRRYQIYKDYGVAVFLHDKVSEEVVGTDYKGDPIYKREMLDISWDFTSDPNSSYSFTYLRTEEGEGDEELTADEIALRKEQEDADVNEALDFVEAYLAKAGATKPFSILLLKELNFNGEVQEFYSSFRTLFISKQVYDNATDMETASIGIIQKQVLNVVQLDATLMAEFEDVSNKNHYYGKRWQQDLGDTFSAELTALTSGTLGYKLSQYYSDNFDAKCNDWANHMAVMYGAMGYNFGVDPAVAVKIYQKPDVVREVCYELVAIAAKYGFIGGGWTSENTYAPGLEADVKNFVNDMLKLGAGGFEQRYGAYPLVMQKFGILRDYIENEIGVSLDYNNLN